MQLGGLDRFQIGLGYLAAPLVGKQAPGFYRYSVGTFEVTVITDGVDAGEVTALACEKMVSKMLYRNYNASQFYRRRRPRGFPTSRP